MIWALVERKQRYDAEKASLVAQDKQADAERRLADALHALEAVEREKASLKMAVSNYRVSLTTLREQLEKVQDPEVVKTLLDELFSSKL